MTENKELTTLYTFSTISDENLIFPPRKCKLTATKNNNEKHGKVSSSLFLNSKAEKYFNFSLLLF
jgi:hypothetical protein